jgi:hypothetical protein
MIRFMRISLPVICVLVLSCVLASEDTARIYVYSQWDSGQSSWLPITYDGTKIAKLKAGRFFAVQVSPGQHRLSAGQGVPLSIEVHAGEDQFVGLEQNITLTQSGESIIPVLTLASPEEARHVVAQLVYISPSKISSTAVDKQDPTVDWSPSLQPRTAHAR